MFTGVDTGFFFALQNEHPSAIDVWENQPIVTSAVVLYELQRKLLQKRFEGWKTVIEDIEKSVLVVPITKDIALKASHIAHVTGMPGLDVLILCSLLEAGCKEIYTMDSHFELYRGKGVKIINLG
ncbi:MAG: PIN domain-containing protein [Nitrospirae bacterium]|nr:PIN domain-containing protein [Nitrospirota bacterium]